MRGITGKREWEQVPEGSGGWYDEYGPREASMRPWLRMGWTGDDWDRSRRAGAQDMAQGRGILRYYGNMGPEVGGEYTEEPLREPLEAETHVGKGPIGYQRNDERLREDVCEELAESDELDASDIVVKVHHAEVTLEGSVSDRRSKRLAELITDEVRGVVDVHNRLRVTSREETPHLRAPSHLAARRA